MRLFALALLLLPAQDVDAKKKRLGELFKQMNQIQDEAQKLLQELSGGDPEKERALLNEIMRAHAPKMAEEMDRAQKAANERNASASLKTLASASADFRANDRDNNRINDFWVGDVSGFYRINSGGGEIQLIEPAVAGADARPCVPLDKAGVFGASKLAALPFPAAPKTGYRYAAVPKYQEDGKELPYHSGDGRNPSKLGFCAYPAEYGVSGQRTFLITEENRVWAKDTGGKAVDVAPEDPRKAGWKNLD